MKIIKLRRILFLVALVITLTTIINYYITNNNSTVVPKSATLVQIRVLGGGPFG